jgi:hypothetical protein
MNGPDQPRVAAVSLGVLLAFLVPAFAQDRAPPAISGSPTRTGETRDGATTQRVEPTTQAVVAKLEQRLNELAQGRDQQQYVWGQEWIAAASKVQPDTSSTYALMIDKWGYYLQSQMVKEGNGDLIARLHFERPHRNQDLIEHFKVKARRDVGREITPEELRKQLLDFIADNQVSFASGFKSNARTIGAPDSIMREAKVDAEIKLLEDLIAVLQKQPEGKVHGLPRP